MAELRSFLIGLLLFSGVIMGISVFYTDLTSSANLASYGYSAEQIANMTPEDLSTKDVTEEINQKVSEIENKLRRRPTGNPSVDASWDYLNAALGALTLPLAAVDLMTTMVADTSNMLGIPPWFGSLVIGIIVLVVVFELLSAYLKWRI